MATGRYSQRHKVYDSKWSQIGTIKGELPAKEGARKNEAVGYGRVSTLGQMDGTSSEEQQRIITEECPERYGNWYTFTAMKGFWQKHLTTGICSTP